MSKKTSVILLEQFRWLKYTLVITSILLLSFWIYFFLVENNDPNVSTIYLAYERAFPIPDIAWIVSLLLLTYYWLSKNDLRGIVTTIAAGGALVFLAMTDICFNTQQDLYTQNLSDGILNLIINILSLGYGLTLVIVGYKMMLAKNITTT